MHRFPAASGVGEQAVDIARRHAGLRRQVLSLQPQDVPDLDQEDVIDRANRRWETARRVAGER